MADSQHGKSAKCFSGIFGRFLCCGNLPTHPSDDQFAQANTKEFAQPENLAIRPDVNHMQVQAGPGVVARLMGLDSFPDLVQKQRTFGSFLRSRSVNFVDYLPQFDIRQSASQHRRVRTSVSFREVPSFDQEKHDFFVLCFEKGKKAEQEEVHLLMRKAEFGYQKKAERRKKYENIEEKMPRKKSRGRLNEVNRIYVKVNPSSKVNSKISTEKHVRRKSRPNFKEKRPVRPKNAKEISAESKVREKRKIRNVQSECVSESSSTVPVFELQEFRLRPRTAKSGENSPVSCTNNSRKVPSGITRNDGNHRKGEETADRYITMLGEIYTWTAEDAKKCSWGATRVSKFEDFEEICIHFEQHLTNLLLNQVVDELLGLDVVKSSAL